MTEDYDWLKYDCPDYNGFPHPKEDWATGQSDLILSDIEVEYCYGMTRQTKSSFRAKPIIAIKHGGLRYHIVTRNGLWSLLDAIVPYMGITKTDVAEMCLNVEMPLSEIVEEILLESVEWDGFVGSIQITYAYGQTEDDENVRVILCAKSHVVENHPPILDDIVGAFAQAMSGPNRDDYTSQVATNTFHNREGRRVVPTFIARHARTGACVYVKDLGDNVLWLHCASVHKSEDDRTFLSCLHERKILKGAPFNLIMVEVLRMYFAAIIGSDLEFERTQAAHFADRTSNDKVFQSLRSAEMDALHNRVAYSATNIHLTLQRYTLLVNAKPLYRGMRKHRRPHPPSYLELSEQFFLHFLGGEKE